jgi:histidine ammonia-lyase
MTSSAPLERVRARLRECVPRLDRDRYLAPDIAAAADLVRSGALTAAAGADLPNLEPTST